MNIKTQLLSKKIINKYHIEVFKELTDFMGINYTVMDVEGNFILKNDHFNKGFSDIHRATELEAWNNCKEVIRNGKRVLIEEEQDGKFYISIKQPLILNAKCEGIMVLSFDITEKKQAEITKIKFLENMRHDIRTPLTGIIGFANLLKSEKDSKKVKQYAENMITSSESLLEYLNSVLEFVRISSEQSPILKNKFNLSQLLQSIIHLNYAKAQEKNLSLDIFLEENMPLYFNGDSKRLHRIILEFVTNALKFTDNGSVSIKAKIISQPEPNNFQNSREVILKISVIDTGIGLPIDKKEEIFIQFNRLHPTYEGNYKGVGLGLTIVKKYVDDLHGELYVESIQDKGSVFSCLIPLKISLSEDDVSAQENIFGTKIKQFKKTSEITKNQHKIKYKKNSQILVVEDSEIVAELTKAMLEELGCSVEIAVNGLDAINKIESSTYDLIFMDIGLPDMNGYQVTQKARQWEFTVDKHTPIIALTAHIEVENKVACIKSGMEAVISKPMSTDTARDILNAFIPSRNNGLSGQLTKEEPKNIKNSSEDDDHIPEITGKIIDLDSASKLLNKSDHVFATKMLKKMIEGFPKEIKALTAAHKIQDWEEIKMLAHKMRGGTSYCGTLRLKIACTNLETYLYTQKESSRENLYHILMTEIDAVKNAVKSNNI